MKMQTNPHRVSILMADDDPDDRLMLQEAFAEGQVRNPLYFVEDGQELLDYLHHRNGHDAKSSPRPGVILLDLNMPRLSGTDALQSIKEDPQLRPIPIIILTTSRAEEDIVRSYYSGASGFIAKPVTLTEFIEVARSFRRYWIDIVEIPAPAQERG